jgi:hypothetical protein
MRPRWSVVAGTYFVQQHFLRHIVVAGPRIAWPAAAKIREMQALRNEEMPKTGVRECRAARASTEPTLAMNLAVSAVADLLTGVACGAPDVAWIELVGYVRAGVQNHSTWAGVASLFGVLAKLVGTRPVFVAGVYPLALKMGTRIVVTRHNRDLANKALVNRTNE